MLRRTLLLLAFTAAGCASAPTVSQTTTTSASLQCSARIVGLLAEDVAPTGKYEVIAVVDPATQGPSDSEYLEERLRDRACALQADAAGPLTLPSGKSEFVALRYREHAAPMPVAAPPKKVSSDAFPLMTRPL